MNWNWIGNGWRSGFSLHLLYWFGIILLLRQGSHILNNRNVGFTGAEYCVLKTHDLTKFPSYEFQL